MLLNKGRTMGVSKQPVPGTLIDNKIPSKNYADVKAHNA
jgi:hypothetical protein